MVFVWEGRKMWWQILGAGGISVVFLNVVHLQPASAATFARIIFVVMAVYCATIFFTWQNLHVNHAHRAR
jgi:hypothetical protein